MHSWENLPCFWNLFWFSHYYQPYKIDINSTKWTIWLPHLYFLNTIYHLV
jgi:hypothetical protein